MTRTAALNTIRQEVARLRMNWADLRKCLPDWVPEAVVHPSGAAEVRFFLASHLGLDIGADGSLRMGALPHARFKTAAGTDIAEIAGARAVVGAVARLIARATVPSWRPVPADPDVFRAEVLGNQPWIDLARLVDACWSRGVPVIYLPHMPVTGEKMPGFVTFAGGRPIILLTRKGEQADWQLFVLAHELGHLAKGHLPLTEGESIIDESIIDEPDADGTIALGDTLEAEADGYAGRLVADGGPKFKLRTLPVAGQLAEICVRLGTERRISPGHLVLNAVNHTSVRGNRPFGLANAALKQVDALTGQASTGDICREALRKHLDWTLLRDESAEFLQSLGIG